VAGSWCGAGRRREFRDRRLSVGRGRVADSRRCRDEPPIPVRDRGRATHPRLQRRRTTGDVTASTRPRSTHWPALDGWRGFTIWFAISVHAGYFTAGGVLSLDTFFVLSGFLITGLLLREWMRHDEEHIDLLRFWARRARRLLPALFVVFGAVLVYAA